MDIQNPRRVLKAWLRCVATGKSFKEVLKEFEEMPGAFDHLDRNIVVLSRPKDLLEERVRLRVDQMIADGLVEEVRSLLNENLLDNPSGAGAIGYRETISYLQGDLSADDLPDKIAQNTRRLLKKQRTWFKKHLPADAVIDVSTLKTDEIDWHLIPAKEQS